MSSADRAVLGWFRPCRRCGKQLAPMEGGWVLDGCCVDCFDPNGRGE